MRTYASFVTVLFLLSISLCLNSLNSIESCCMAEVNILPQMEKPALPNECKSSLAEVLSQSKTNKCVNGRFSRAANRCICYQCYEGEDCSILRPNCYIYVNTQQCTECTKWWDLQDDVASVQISASSELSYQFNSSMDGIGTVLSNSILKLHQKFGNAETEGYHVVYGGGATQLIHAVMYAFHKAAGRPLQVYARPPFYEYYRVYALQNPSWANWNPSTDLNPDDVIELVCIPNNPSGEIPKEPFYKTPNIVHDLVYWWPHCTNHTYKRSDNVMLFSLSKMTGHHGSRFGWALVKDEKIAKLMNDYMWLMTHGVSTDSQYRALAIINNILKDDGKFFEFMKDVMNRRWNRLLDLFNKYGKGKFEVSSPHGWVVAWIKCLKEVECGKLFHKYNIGANNGEDYGMHSYARFNMMGEESTFEILLQYLEKMLKEN